MSPVVLNSLSDPKATWRKVQSSLWFSMVSISAIGNQTRSYLLSQGRAIWEIIQEAYVILATFENTIQGEVQRYENNYKALNLITIAQGRNVYDHVSHLETAHDVWLKLCNTYEGSSEIKSSRKDTNNR
jgi:hypothetical protein